MFALRWTRLTGEFDAAYRQLAAARIAYDDQPRDPDVVAALGAARIRLDEARSTMRAERERLGLEEPWRVEPSEIAGVDAPPLWSIEH